MESKDKNQDKIIKSFFDENVECCCIIIVCFLIAFVGFFGAIFLTNPFGISLYLLFWIGIFTFFYIFIRFDSGKYCEHCKKRVHPIFKEHNCRIEIKKKTLKPLSGKMLIKLHPKVKETSLDLFNNGHYVQAVFESVKALNNYVKEKAKITDKDLAGAMAKAFDENNPIIRLNKLKTQSDIDEQRGFKFLFMGAMTGIRNPMGHETYELNDKNIALEYLIFLSLLFRKAEEGKI